MIGADAEMHRQTLGCTSLWNRGRQNGRSQRDQEFHENIAHRIDEAELVGDHNDLSNNDQPCMGLSTLNILFLCSKVLVGSLTVEVCMSRLFPDVGFLLPSLGCLIQR